MKNKVMVALIAGLMTLSSLPVWAATATIEGTVTGYLCAVLNKACPADREDPVVAAERTFVVVKPDGEFYLVPNVDRAVMARHITEKVRVTGSVDPKYKAIEATSLEVMKQDKWATLWSQAMEDEAMRALYYNR